MFVKRLSHFRPRTETLGQGIGHVGQRIPGTVGYDELALAKQGFRLVPFGDVGKGIHADQDEKFVAGLE